MSESAIDDGTGRRMLGLLIDLLLVAGLVTIGQIEFWLPLGTSYPGTAPPVVSAIAIALVPLALVLRRRWPVATLIAVAAVLVVPRLAIVTPVTFWGGFVALLVGLYSASRYARRPRDLWSPAIPALVLCVFSLIIPGFFAFDELGQTVPLLVASWLAGQAMRGWRARLTRARETAAAAEYERAQAAIADERATIARELHDIVAHCVSLMVLQSGSARLQIRSDPAASEAALRIVESTGREALAEMRRMLGLLRATGEPAGLDPQPSLSSIDRLAETMRAAGMPVTVEIDGKVHDLPPGLDLSAYRIVQESLTNALRHSGGRATSVHVGFRPRELRLDIVTEGAPGARRISASRPGQGITGMRERAALFGGRLDAGVTGDGGFRVSAALPLAEAGA